MPRFRIQVLFEECSGATSGEVFSSLNNSDSRPSNFLFQIARGSGLHSVSALFLQKNAHHSQKSTHHPKIPRSATWFRSRKHSGDACSCSTRPGGTKQGFQSSTMKCSGACRCGTHGIHHKEERRSSLIRIPPM